LKRLKKLLCRQKAKRYKVFYGICRPMQQH
jgi:hypothetical protein